MHSIWFAVKVACLKFEYQEVKVNARGVGFSHTDNAQSVHTAYRLTQICIIQPKVPEIYAKSLNA